MKTIKFYIKKQDKLKTAIEKVKAELIKFSEGERMDKDNWNHFHNLEDRLTDRLKDNYFESQSNNFEKYGFAIY